MDAKPLLMRKRAAMNYLGVGRKIIEHLVREGRLHPKVLKRGGNHFYLRSELESIVSDTDKCDGRHQ